MSLFFAGGGTAKKGRGGKRPQNISVATLHKAECRACPLNNAKVETPKMAPSGAKKPIVYFLGEAPGRIEDEDGKPFVGDSGQMLRGNVPKRYKRKVRYNNCIRTRPPDNRDPTWAEIECCRPSIIRDIEAAEPKLIIGLGNTALNWATGQNTIFFWRARLIPVRVGRHVCWFYPLPHPSGLLRKRKKGYRGKETKHEDELIFERDIAYIFNEVEVLGDPPYVEKQRYFDGIKYVTGHKGEKDIDQIEAWLWSLRNQPEVAVDIETASNESIKKRKLRPYGLGSRILSVAVSIHSKTYAFPLHHPGAGWTAKQLEAVEDLLLWFLCETKCAKIAHNLYFELEWFGTLYGRHVIRASPWLDTMAQGYVLNFRKIAKRTNLSLDNLCFSHFGFELKSLFNLDMNNLDKEPLEKVLPYNACDAKYTFSLHQEQQVELINQGLVHVYEDQVRRTPTAVLTQMAGWQIDQGEVEYHQKRLAKAIRKVNKEIQQVPEVIEYQKRRRQPYDVGSRDHLLELLVNYCGFDADDLKTEDKKTGKLKFDTQADALDEVDHPIAELTVRHRHLTKLKSTYVDPNSIKDGGEVIYPDKMLHPHYNTMFVETRRGSSDEPNGQNYPYHPGKGKEVRSQVVAYDVKKYAKRRRPRKMKLVKFDFGQIEARVFGMVSLDKKYCESLWTNFDIHTFWAERLATACPYWAAAEGFWDDDKRRKEARQISKNNFVFPSFFGANYKSVAGYLKLKPEDIEPIIEEFWDEYAGIHKWQEEVVQFYKENHYVELLTGFRRRAPIIPTKVINTPIQGTASEITMQSWNRISELAQATGEWELQPRINIHDDLTFGLYEDRLEQNVEQILDIMLKPQYSFINVPILVEVEIGDSWDKMEVFDDFRSDEW